MKKLLLTLCTLAALSFPISNVKAGWLYWDHGRLMWANKWGYVEDVAQVEAEDAQQALQDKLDELGDKLDAIREAQEDKDE